jgi:hypothetical protein
VIARAFVPLGPCTGLFFMIGPTHIALAPSDWI